MPSFEEEDERISTQRTARRIRQTWSQHPSISQRTLSPTAATRRASNRHAEAQEDFDIEEEQDDEEVMVTPEPTHKSKRRKATASVSFSEPVETPQRQPQQQRQRQRAQEIEKETTETAAPKGRNRLETRLAELQRDVANLSLRLRASSSASQHALSMQDDEDDDNNGEITGTSLYSTEDSRVALGLDTRLSSRRSTTSNNHAAPALPLRTKSPARTILKTAKSTPELSKPRLANKSPSRVPSRRREPTTLDEDESELRIHRDRQHDRQPEPQPQPRSTKEMLRAVRDLRVVAVERDQLRFDLEQTRRALVAMEKKFTDAIKWKAAYDKMKTHCDSLQESLDLSEKIRIRQKKLLLQLQQSLKQSEDAASTRKSSQLLRTAQRVDVLDSILASSSKEPQPRPRKVGEGAAAGSSSSTSRTTRATRTPAATTRPPSSASSNNRPAATAHNTSTSRSFTKSDFDSLLQIPLRDRQPTSSAAAAQQRAMTRLMNESRLRTTTPTPTTAAARQTKTSSHAVPTATATATARVTKARGYPATATTTTTRTNHFLAPTQASLGHMAKHKPDTTRRPFVV